MCLLERDISSAKQNQFKGADIFLQTLPAVHRFDSLAIFIILRTRVDSDSRFWEGVFARGKRTYICRRRTCAAFYIRARVLGVAPGRQQQRQRSPGNLRVATGNITYTRTRGIPHINSVRSLLNVIIKN